MKRSITALVAGLLLAGCFNVVDGGAALSETRTVEGFTRVRVDDGLPARVLPGAAQVVITAPQKVVENLQTVVKNGQLIVGLKPGVLATSFSTTDVLITLPEVTSVEATGGSQVAVSGVVASPFRAMASGGSRLAVTGTSTDLRASASGGSTVDASALTVRTASVDASGGSTLQLNASLTVEGSASGGSTVHVSGSADVSAISVSGGASVRRAE